MTRAYRSPPSPAGLAFALACFGLGCNSDDPYNAPPATVTTDPYETEGVPFTTGEPNDTSTGDYPPGEQTCYDAITCLFDCLINLPPDNPEPDLACVFACTDPLSVGEVLKLLKLTQCVFLNCEEIGECNSQDPSMQDSDVCTNCRLIGIVARPPIEACMAEGNACQ